MDDSTVSGGNPAPTSFAEAFAADASPAPDQTTPSESTQTPAAEAAPPSAGGTTPAADDPRSPFIPRPRFDEVNTERNELKTWKEQYAWAEKLKRDEVEQLMAFRQAYAANPIETLQAELAALQQNPVYAQQLRSLAARQLAAGRGQTQPAAPDLNPIPVQLEDGRTVSLYSAEQIAALKAEWAEEIKREFAPVVQTVEEQRRATQQAETQRKAQEFGQTTFAELKTWPGMDLKENQVKVRDELAAMRFDSDDPRDVTLALNAVYRKVVLPTLNQKAQSQLLDNLQQKAAASTSPNPGSAVPTGQKSPTSFHDKSLIWR